MIKFSTTCLIHELYITSRCPFIIFRALFYKHCNVVLENLYTIFINCYIVSCMHNLDMINVANISQIS